MCTIITPNRKTYEKGTAIQQKGGVIMIYTYYNTTVIEESAGVRSVMSSAPYARSKRQRREERSSGKSFAEVLKKSRGEKTEKSEKLPYEALIGRA